MSLATASERLTRLRPAPRGGRAGPGGPEANLPLVGHLRELRDRLIRAALAVALTTALSFLFVDHLMAAFLALTPAGLTIQVVQPTEAFSSYFKVALTFGLAAAMPVVVYQVFRFLSPGLKAQERRWLLVTLPLITAFFAAGVLFSYFVLLPPAISFLYSFGAVEIARNWLLSDYIGFVTKFVLAAGLTFQLPPLMFLLARLGIADARKMAGFRRYAVVLAAVAAAIITPTTDPFNLLLLAVPIYLLYELGVQMARLAPRN